MDHNREVGQLVLLIELINEKTDRQAPTGPSLPEALTLPGRKRAKVACIVVLEDINARTA